MKVYLHQRPLSLLLVVHANIPLRLPLLNAIRRSTIHRRSIAASGPLLPAKATEKGGGLAVAAATVLYRRRRCSVARTVSHDNYDYRCRTAVRMSHRTPRYHWRRVRTAAADPIGTVAVVATVVLRRGPLDITGGAAAATAE